MTARKYKTLGNIYYVIDRKGKLYIDNGKVKRSKDNYYYELTVNINGYWTSYSDKYTNRADAMAKIKELAGIL
jgi:hypothetical protein